MFLVGCDSILMLYALPPLVTDCCSCSTHSYALWFSGQVV